MKSLFLMKGNSLGRMRIVFVILYEKSVKCHFCRRRCDTETNLPEESGGCGAATRRRAKICEFYILDLYPLSFR
jgi:hypothetical protein